MSGAELDCRPGQRESGGTMPGTRARSALNRPPLFVSYAGNLEDVILNRVFPQQTGFFVDIGANDPVFGSNTWALYQRGWRGIAIEPSPRVYAKFKAKRPQDICLNVAVGDVEGEISFFQFGDGAGHSTCDRKRAEALRLELGQEMTEFKVPVRTLGNILAEHAQGLDIDVVCIDAEGAEAAILLGAQLDRFRPKLIVIEAMAAFTQVDESQEATRILEQNGYKLGYEDGLNKFFAVKEDAALLEALRYPPSVFDHYITVGELSLRHKSRRRLRLLQLALVGWALSIVLILIAVLLVF